MDDDGVKDVIAEASAYMQSVGGSVIVRKSGTEPLIKIRVEAEDINPVKTAMQNIVTKIEQFM